MNTIKNFISCNENIQIFTRARTRENTDVFISLDDNIYGIHSERINILYIFDPFIAHYSTTHTNAMSELLHKQTQLFGTKLFRITSFLNMLKFNQSNRYRTHKLQLGLRDRLVIVKSIPAFHHSVDFVFKSIGVIDSIVEL